MVPTAVEGDRFGEMWFCSESQRVLAKLLHLTDDIPGAVVEVGSWTGRSTVALANACYPSMVHAVDTWNGSPGEISADLATQRDVYGEFKQNIRDLTRLNVLPCRMGWRMWFAANRRPIRFLFIDAEHSYVEVRDNIAAALPLMSPGGIICGDDQSHPPVREAVTEAFPDAAVSATVWFAQIPKEP